jgi:hypothetical protein
MLRQIPPGTAAKANDTDNITKYQAERQYIDQVPSPSSKEGGLIMNNIELRLMAEGNWREEHLSKCLHTKEKRRLYKFIWNTMSLLDFILCCDNQLLSNNFRR